MSGRRGLCAAALWWTGVLLWGLSTRAFDLSDPAQQLLAAERSASVLRAAGPRAWAGAVCAGSLAKPAQNAALSQALAAGLEASPQTYHLVTGVFVLSALLLLQWCVLALFGAQAALLFAALCAASSAVLAEAYHGGHTWYGQAFLWAGLALELGRPRKPRNDALVGALAGLSVLSSHHMVPLAAALGLLRLLRSRGQAWPWLALGALGPLLTLEAVATGAGRPHYWNVLGHLLSLATQAKDPALSSVHAFVFRWLFGSEGVAFGAMVVLGAALGVKDRPKLLGPLLLGAFVLYELSFSLRIGRVQLPFLLALFAAAAGAAGPRLKGWAPLAALLILAGAAPRLLETRRAFHARPQPSAPPIVVGSSLPFFYAEKARVATCAQLAALAPAPDEPVLVSRWSGWFWRGFLPPERFDVPVEALFASSARYAAVPGVESHAYQLYSNDALHYRVLRGELPFPVANRLYRAHDVLAACGRKSI